MTTSTKRIIACASVLVVAIIVSLLAWLMTFREPPPLQLALADGRILQIEAVTFGTDHEVGKKSMLLERFGPWLPSSIRQHLAPRYPYAQIDQERAGLVVWVNARRNRRH